MPGLGGDEFDIVVSLLLDLNDQKIQGEFNQFIGRLTESGKASFEKSGRASSAAYAKGTDQGLREGLKKIVAASEAQQKALLISLEDFTRRRRQAINQANTKENETQRQANRVSLQQQKGFDAISYADAQGAAVRRTALFKAALRDLNDVARAGFRGLAEITRAAFRGVNTVIGATFREGTSLIRRLFSRRHDVYKEELGQETNVVRSGMERQTSVIRSQLAEQNAVFSRAAERRLLKIEETQAAQTRVVTAGAVKQAEAQAAIQAKSSQGVLGAASGRSPLGGAFLGLAALGGGGLIFRGIFTQAIEAQKTLAQTNAVLKSTGGIAGVTAGHVNDLSNKLSVLTATDDETVAAAENLLLTFTNIRNTRTDKIFDETTRAVLDTSVALKQDLKSSAIQIGKALQDPIKGITALRRVGVAFSAQQVDQIKVMVASGHTLDAQKLILRELNKEFGGSAAAAATAGGRFKVVFQNIQEQIGTAIMPAITVVLDALSSFFNALATGKGLWKVARDGLVGIAAGLGAILAVKGAVEVISLAGKALAFLTASPIAIFVTSLALLSGVLFTLIKNNAAVRAFFSGLVTGMKNWFLVGLRAKESFGPLLTVTGLFSRLGVATRNTIDFFSALARGFLLVGRAGFALGKPIESLSNIVLLQSTIGAAARVIFDSLGLIRGAMSDLFHGDFEKFHDKFFEFWHNLSSVLAPAGNLLRDAFHSAVAAAGDFLSALFGGAAGSDASAASQLGERIRGIVGRAFRTAREAVASFFAGLFTGTQGTGNDDDASRSIAVRLRSIVVRAARLVQTNVTDLFRGLFNIREQLGTVTNNEGFVERIFAIPDSAAGRLGARLRELLSTAFSKIGDVAALAGRFLGRLLGTIGRSLEGLASTIGSFLGPLLSAVGTFITDKAIPAITGALESIGRFLARTIFSRGFIDGVTALAGSLVGIALTFAFAFIKGFIGGLISRRGDILRAIFDILGFVAKSIFSSGNPFLIIGSLLIAAFTGAKIFGAISGVFKQIRLQGSNAFDVLGGRIDVAKQRTKDFNQAQVATNIQMRSLRTNSPFDFIGQQAFKASQKIQTAGKVLGPFVDVARTGLLAVANGAVRVSDAFPHITSAIGTAASAVRTKIGPAFDSLGQRIEGVGKKILGLQGTTTTATGRLINSQGRFVSDTTKNLGFVQRELGQFVTRSGQTLSALATGTSTFGQAFSRTFNGLKGTATRALTGIGDAVLNVGGRASNAFRNLRTNTETQMKAATAAAAVASSAIGGFFAGMATGVQRNIGLATIAVSSLIAGISTGSVLIGGLTAVTGAVGFIFGEHSKFQNDLKAARQSFRDIAKEAVDSGRTVIAVFRAEAEIKGLQNIRDVAKDASLSLQGLGIDAKTVDRLIRGSAGGFDDFVAKVRAFSKDNKLSFGQNLGVEHLIKIIGDLRNGYKLSSEDAKIYGKTLDDLGIKTDSAGGKSAGAAPKVDKLKDALNKAKDAAQGAKDKFIELVTGFTNLPRAQIDAAAALDTFTAAFTRNNHGLDTNTEKGRTNLNNLLALTQSQAELAAATENQTHVVGTASKIMDAYGLHLVDAGIKAGLTKDQINELLIKAGFDPGTMHFKTDTKPLDDAARKLNETRYKAALLHNKHVDIFIKTHRDHFSTPKGLLEIVGGFFGAGKAAGQGFHDGLALSTGLALAGGIGLGESAKKGLNIPLIFGSPSKAMLLLGIDTALGFIAGIALMHGAVEAATAELGNAAKTGIARTSGIFDRLTEVWSGAAGRIEKRSGVLRDRFGETLRSTSKSAQGIVTSMFGGIEAKSTTSSARQAAIAKSLRGRLTGEHSVERHDVFSIVASMFGGIESKSRVSSARQGQTAASLKVRLGNEWKATSQRNQATVGAMHTSILSAATSFFGRAAGQAERGGRGIGNSLHKGIQSTKSTVIKSVGLFAAGIVGALNPILSGIGSKTIDLGKIGIQPFARGGRVPGPQHLNYDSVLAALTPGEVVINKPRVRQLGTQNVLDLNEGKVPKGWHIPGFAKGGIIPGYAKGGQITSVGGGWQALIEALRQAGIPNRVVSTVRPGAITHASHNVSLHALGRAVDFTGPGGSGDVPGGMRIFNFFDHLKGIYELFYSWADHYRSHGGIPHPIAQLDPITKADHWSHVHAGTGVGGGGPFTGVGAALGKILAGVTMPQVPKVDEKNWLGKTGGEAMRHVRLLGQAFADAHAAAPSTSTGAGSSSAPLGPISGGLIARIEATIKSLESGGNYRAYNAASGAAGAYQFLATTWRNYGGYPSAHLAPPAVQDARAAQDIRMFLSKYGGKVEAVPASWYVGHYDPNHLDWTPPGNRVSVRAYIEMWMKRFAQTAPTKAFGLASGGMVPGPAHVTHDSVLAHLTPGEVVVNKRRVRQLGTQNVVDLNEGRVPKGWHIPGFREGGVVGGRRIYEGERGFNWKTMGDHRASPAIMRAFPNGLIGDMNQTGKLSDKEWYLFNAFLVAQRQQDQAAARRWYLAAAAAQWYAAAAKGQQIADARKWYEAAARDEAARKWYAAAAATDPNRALSQGRGSPLAAATLYEGNRGLMEPFVLSAIASVGPAVQRAVMSQGFHALVTSSPLWDSPRARMYTALDYPGYNLRRAGGLYLPPQHRIMMGSQTPYRDTYLHEMGHHIDWTVDGPWNLTGAKSLTLWSRHHGSSYGRTNPVEGYAEFFKDWIEHRTTGEAERYFNVRFGSRRGFEQGGVTTHDGLYRLSEGNKRELVLPLSDPKRMLELLRQEGLVKETTNDHKTITGSQMSLTQNIHTNALDPEVIAHVAAARMDAVARKVSA